MELVKFNPSLLVESQLVTSDRLAAHVILAYAYIHNSYLLDLSIYLSNLLNQTDIFTNGNCNENYL